MPKNRPTQIQYKHDIEANWQKATGFTYRLCESIIYDINNHESIRKEH